MKLAAYLIVALIAISACSPPDKGDTAANSNLSDEKHVWVETQDEFTQALKTATPGTTIVLAEGEWRDFDMVVRGSGSEEAPIRVAAETPGKVVLTGQSSLRLGGNHLIVSGLLFQDGHTPRSEVISFRIDDETLANNSRVTNSVIANYSNPDRRQRDLWVGLYGRNNSFDHNHLEGKQNAGPTLAVRLTTEESRNNNHHIFSNYFGPRPVFGSNGGETFRIGTSHYSLTDSNTLVENNFFDRCSGEVEIVSNKSGGNVFRSNTFYASRGTLTLRHGNGTLIERNLFDGAGAAYTGGVRVINARQTIRNNYFRNLTGNRFSGALVIMNGVPDSPINRYHQVDEALVENNIFDRVAAIELGEGSDAERTAVPVNSVFSGNVIIGRKEVTPFTLYDDMSGISFRDNFSASRPPESLLSGFEVQDGLSPTVSVSDYGVDKEDTGVDWYPKSSADSPFAGGDVVNLSPGVDVLSSAIAMAKPGDQFVLGEGQYHEAKSSIVGMPISFSAADGAQVDLSFERPSLFVLSGQGGLSIKGINVSGARAPDGKGNSFITTSSTLGSGNHPLTLDGMSFSDFNVNQGFSVVSATKGSFFDYIRVTSSNFDDISGVVFKLDQETDDYGIYNSEYLTISDSKFTNIGGSVASIYRGGRDESTFGPHVDVSGSEFRQVGETGTPLMVLHGIQKGSFTGNSVVNAQPIDLTFTTGLPVFLMSDNQVEGIEQDAFANLTDLRNRK